MPKLRPFSLGFIIGSLLWLCSCSDTSLIRSGTAIAAMRTPSEIVIAADSRVSDGDGKLMPDECKIRVVGDTVFAAAGVSGALGGFDLFDLAANALQQPGDFDSQLKSVADTVLPALGKSLHLTRSKDPAFFDRTIDDKVSNLIVAKYEGGSNRLVWIEFIVHDPRGELTVDATAYRCPGPACPDGNGGFLYN